MRTQSLQWFIDNNCELSVRPIVPFDQLYVASKGDPCNTCNLKDKCSAWKKISPTNIETRHNKPQKVGETNAEIAARTGLTKRQVAKKLRAGEVL